MEKAVKVRGGVFFFIFSIMGGGMRIIVVSIVMGGGVLFSFSAYAEDKDTERMLALKAEIDLLRSTLEQMQNRLSVLEGEAEVYRLQADAKDGRGSGALKNVRRSVLPERDSVMDNAVGASRPDSEPSPTDPELKGFIAIPGTETYIRFGGYAKLDLLDDLRNAADLERLVPITIPVDSPRHRGGNFEMDAKLTRLSFEARRPTSRGNLRFYLENDFFGSENYQFRLRHAYGQLGNTFAGYGYSTFVDADSLPDTLDQAGPGGSVSLRVAGIHQSFKVADGLSYTVGMENPQTQFVRDERMAITDATKEISRIPDVAMNLRLERAWGHMQWGGVIRQLGVDSDLPIKHDRAFGGGVQFSGTVGKSNDYLLQWAIVGGRGVERYLSDTSGFDLDAVVRADGKIRALSAVGGYVALMHYWTPEWRSNLVLSSSRLQREDLLSASAFRESRYAAVNLIWSPLPSWTMGAELLYERLQTQDRKHADALRMQASLKYSFIK